MRALVLTAFHRVEVCERPEPEPGDGQVVLEVAACGICGSDVHGFLGEEKRRQPGLVLGHECVGTVVAPARPDLPAGTRVAVNPLVTCGRCSACIAGRTNQCQHKRLLGLDDVPGAFAERTLIARRNVFPLAAGVPDESACLIEPLACAVHLLDLAEAPPYASLALFGGGTLGAMTLVVAKGLGCRPITVIEPSAGRREAALALGADAVLDPRTDDVVGTLTAGEGTELVIDATGVAPARRDAVLSARPGATVLLLGTTDLATDLDWRDVVRRELRLQASYGFTAADFARAKGLVESGSVDLRPWTRAYRLDQGQEAFESLLPAPDDVLKVLLRPALVDESGAQR